MKEPTLEERLSALQKRELRARDRMKTLQTELQEISDDMSELAAKLTEKANSIKLPGM